MMLPRGGAVRMYHRSRARLASAMSRMTSAFARTTQAAAGVDDSRTPATTEVTAA